MDTALILEIIRTILSVAIIPAMYWAWSTRRDITDLKKSQQELKESNSRDHAMVVAELKEVRLSIAAIDKQNQKEHNVLGERIHELDKVVSIDQAVNKLKA